MRKKKSRFVWSEGDFIVEESEGEDSFEAMRRALESDLDELLGEEPLS